MPYLMMADLTGMIPGQFLIEALDDDGDGAADPAVLSVVLQQASDAVDAILGVRFTTPFQNPIPTIVQNAAKIFAAELCYQRRGKSAEDNPFTKQANQLRDPENGILSKIAKGELPLAPTLERAKASVSIIGDPAKTTSQTGRISA
jgi:phage gp36-like protein